jgi:hypothetical protein
MDLKKAVRLVLVIFAFTSVEAKLGHNHVHELRHTHRQYEHVPRAVEDKGIAKRDGHCAFPTNAGLVAVTPGSSNAGWAMSPDQPCMPGHYCPYACPPGQLMAQWDPSATSYTYPASMVS